MHYFEKLNPMGTYDPQLSLGQPRKLDKVRNYHKLTQEHEEMTFAQLIKHFNPEPYEPDLVVRISNAFNRWWTGVDDNGAFEASIIGHLKPPAELPDHIIAWGVIWHREGSVTITHDPSQPELITTNQLEETQP